MKLDLLTAGIGIFSFIIFLLIHGITFRWVHPERLLKSLLSCVVAIMAFPVLIMGALLVSKAIDIGIQAAVLSTLVALIIQGLLCFFYVLCIFGPYETSVRMRLVREIATAPNGMTMADILGRYNVKTIVDLRLRRLIGSGDIIEKDGRYLVARRKNLFFIFDAIAGVLKKCIGRSRAV